MHTVLYIRSLATRGRLALVAGALAALLSACGGTGGASGDSGRVSDTTPPAISLSSLAGTVSGIITLNASASDNVGVAGVQFLLDGGTPIGAEDTSAPYSVSWNTATTSNGTHTLTVVARDAAGNRTTSSAVTVTVGNSTPPSADTSKPTVSLTAPTAGATVSGSVTVSANASDNVGVVGVQFKLNGANLGAEDTAAPYTVSWDTSTTTDGSYTLTAVARDAAGNTTTSAGTTVTVGNVPSPGFGTAVFPMRVEPGTRYLIDAAGKPFLMNGEAAWGLIVQLTREEVDQYLDNRRQKGINTLLVMLVAKHVLISNSPHNAYGDGPFLTAGDFSTPNENYFAHADWVINRAAQKGFLVLLAPSYTGYQGTGEEGWYPEMVANGVSKLRSYGQYVGKRYQGFSNVLWVQGGDFNPPTAGKDLIRAVASGIRDVETRSLHTFHGARGTAAMQYWGTTEPWLSVNDIYTDQYTVVAAAYREYGRSTTPFFLIEARYENEGASEALVRTQAYQAILGGGFGHVMGNRPMWGFMSGWQSALDSPASRSIQYVRTLLEQRKWWTLEPDTNAMLLTAGIGTDADRAVTTRASDGSFAIAYLPSVRMVTIDLTKLNGPRVNARWCDPTNGVCTTASGSPFLATGSQTFLPPGPNSTNFGDWMLTLDSQQ